MKTFTGILATLTLGALLLTGCVNEEPPYKRTDNGSSIPATTGYLNGPALSLQVIADAQTDIQGDNTEDATQTPPGQLAKTRAEIETDNYRVKIVNTSDQQLHFDGSFKELADQLAAAPMELPIGNYELKVCSHRDEEIQAAAWDTPVYGATRPFSITKDATTTIEQITCTLQNIKVTVLCSADLAEQLAADATATVSLGDAVLEFNKEQWDGLQAAFFMPSAAESDLEFVLNGTFVEGGDASFSRTISGVKAGQWRKIELVIAYASEGEIKLDIQVDNFLLDETITINGTEGLTEEALEEEGGGEEPGGEESLTVTMVGHDINEPYSLETNPDGSGKPVLVNIASASGIKTLSVRIESEVLEPLLTGELEPLKTGVDLCTINKQDQLGITLGALLPVGDEIKNRTQVEFEIKSELVTLLLGMGSDNEEVVYKFHLNVSDNAGENVITTLTLIKPAKN